MVIRVIKLGLVALVSLFLLLVGLDNLLDYDTNYAFVQHVLLMDTVPVHSKLTTRAVQSPLTHQAVYGVIISTQLLAGVFCLAGAVVLWRARSATAIRFNGHKHLAAMGLAMAFALWFFGFMVVGGEWF